MGQETPTSMGGELGYSEELMLVYPIYRKTSLKPSGNFEADQQALTYLKRLIDEAFCNELAARTDEEKKRWQEEGKRLTAKRDSIAAIYAPPPKKEIKKAIARVRREANKTEQKRQKKRFA